jgi:hypothetical protein
MTKTTETRHSTPIIRLYAALVKAGRRTIEQVPEAYRQDVADYLAGLID